MSPNSTIHGKNERSFPCLIGRNQKSRKRKTSGRDDGTKCKRGERKAGRQVRGGGLRSQKVQKSRKTSQGHVPRKKAVKQEKFDKKKLKIFYNSNAGRNVKEGKCISQKNGNACKRWLRHDQDRLNRGGTGVYVNARNNGLEFRGGQTPLNSYSEGKTCWGELFRLYME